jgi:hypothetical protein
MGRNRARTAIIESPLLSLQKAGTYFSTIRNFLKDSQYLASGMGSCSGTIAPTFAEEAFS